MGEIGEVEMHRLWREADNHLNAYVRSVKECKGLEAALGFCDFLEWSGLIKLMKVNSTTGPLRVDGWLVESKVNELRRQIRERFQSGAVEPQLDVAELERINRKLDLIAGLLAKQA